MSHIDLVHDKFSVLKSASFFPDISMHGAGRSSEELPNAAMVCAFCIDVEIHSWCIGIGYIK